MRFRIVVFLLLFLPTVGRAQSQEADDLSKCQINPIGDEAQPVFLDIGQGSRLSNIRLADTQDSLPVITVEIRKQSKPVHLFLHSRADNIWEIEAEPGAVDTIYIFSRFMNQPYDGPRVAIRSKLDVPIVYRDSRKCLETGRDRQKNKRRYNHIVEFLNDRLGPSLRIKEMVPRARTAVVHNGYVRFPEEDVSFNMQPGIESLLQSFPGGYVELDPSSISSRVPLSTLSVLPETMGVLQYLKRGVFRAPTEKDFDAFRAAFGSAVRPQDLDELGSYVDLVVTESVELPSRLHGAKRVNFLALPGVEVTGNTAGCIQYVDGPKFGDGCGTIGRAFKQFRAMLDVPLDEDCTIVETSAQTRLFVARYDPKNFWKRRISILPSTEAILVVDSPEPVRWTLEVPPSSRLTHVIYLGHEDQEIEGIPEETSVVDYVINDVRPLMPRACYRLPVSSSARAFGIFADSVLSMIGRQLTGLDPAISIIPQDGR